MHLTLITFHPHPLFTESALQSSSKRAAASQISRPSSQLLGKKCRFCAALLPPERLNILGNGINFSSKKVYGLGGTPRPLRMEVQKKILTQKTLFFGHSLQIYIYGFTKIEKYCCIFCSWDIFRDLGFKD